jgi:hypothetical protein
MESLLDRQSDLRVVSMLHPPESAGSRAETNCCIPLKAAYGSSPCRAVHLKKFNSPLSFLSPARCQSSNLLGFLNPVRRSVREVSWDLRFRPTDGELECSLSASCGSYRFAALLARS